MPVVLDSEYNDRLVGGLKLLDEVLRRNVVDVDAFYDVIDAIPREVEIFGVVLLAPTFAGFKL